MPCIISLIFLLMLQVMTLNPECVTLETTILDALHVMHDGKFLHLPVVDKGECIFNPQNCLFSFQVI
jgi:CBS domain-containing protein